MPARMSKVEREDAMHEAIVLSAGGMGYTAIGEKMGLSRQTVKKLIDDGYALRAERRDNDKERHLAVYEAVQQAAWEKFRKADVRSMNSSNFLNTIKACEDSKVKLTGAQAPEKHRHEVDTAEPMSEEDAAFVAAVEAYVADKARDQEG